MMYLLPAVASTHRKPVLNVVQNCDALTLLRGLSDGCIDAVITDPPYAEIDRDYGRLTEAQWRDLMYPLVVECRRVLKPTGSAVFILQPNMEYIGRMRLWLWEFMVYCGRTWNVIQDMYWWNYAPMPTSAATIYGLCKPSIKNCVWVGEPDAYRNQSEVLWKAKQESLANGKGDYALHYSPSGHLKRPGRFVDSIERRGGVLPQNLLPITNGGSVSTAGAFGHGAGTPAELMDWWLRYITKPGDVVLDPFMGTGTLALAARELGRHFIGSEKMPEDVQTARRRLAQTDPYQSREVAPGLIQKSMFQGMSV